MARESYEQSIDNPIQLDRLPASRPTIEFPCRRGSDIEHIAVLVCWGICLIAASTLSWFTVSRIHSLPVPPPSILAIVAGAMLTVVGVPTHQQVANRHLRMISAAHDAAARFLFGTTLFTGVLLLFVFAYLPPALHLACGAVGLGCLVSSFGQHSVGLCTTFPTRRAKAWSLRRRCDWALRGIALWPILLLYLGYTFGILAELIGATLIVVPLAAMLFAASRPAALVTAPVNAVIQWCTYNLHGFTTPGLYVGPAGSWLRRLLLTAISCFFCAALLGGPTWRATVSANSVTSLIGSVSQDSAVSSLLVLAFPAILSLAIPTFLTWPVTVYASTRGGMEAQGSRWSELVSELRSSPDPIERESIVVANIVADGSPVLVPRSVYKNHGHFVGDSGSGKTSLGIAPTIEQLIRFGDSSFVVLDLKGDSLEILASMTKAAEEVRNSLRIPLQLKHFSLLSDRSTFAFNPLKQSFWPRLQPHVQSDILCTAFGLNYGTDYGPSWYTAANSEVCQRTVSAAPNAHSLRELASALDIVMNDDGPNRLEKEVKGAGVHVQLILKRLANIAALNVTAESAPPEVAEQAIDLSTLFETPQLLYFHLPSLLMPSGAPEIGRLVIYALLSAAAMAEKRRCQVFLVVDEFQRLVANNLEALLQLARSMNVGMILANQSMQDLKTATTDLRPALEANCRIRQWFGASSSDDRERVVNSSGETLEEFATTTISESTTSTSISRVLKPRFSQNDVLLVTDHPKHSILCLKNGAGYAQFGGFQVLVESDYHITAEEYDARRSMPWPEPGHGAFMPNELIVASTPPPAFLPPPRKTPNITTELFGHTLTDGLASAPVPDPRPKNPTKSGRRKKGADQ